MLIILIIVGVIVFSLEAYVLGKLIKMLIDDQKIQFGKN